MLRAVVVLVALAGAMPHAFGENFNSVKGTGVSRSSEEDCKRDLPAFEHRLRKQGLVLTKKIECEAVDGEANAFAPVFAAHSARRFVAETAQTIYQPSRALCERTLHALLAGVADSNEVIVDAGCQPLSILDGEDEDKITETFQPTVVLLKDADQPSNSSDEGLEVASR